MLCINRLTVNISPIKINNNMLVTITVWDIAIYHTGNITPTAHKMAKKLSFDHSESDRVTVTYFKVNDITPDIPAKSRKEICFWASLTDKNITIDQPVHLFGMKGVIIFPVKRALDPWKPQAWSHCPVAPGDLSLSWTHYKTGFLGIQLI